MNLVTLYEYIEKNKHNIEIIMKEKYRLSDIQTAIYLDSLQGLRLQEISENNCRSLPCVKDNISRISFILENHSENRQLKDKKRSLSSKIFLSLPIIKSKKDKWESIENFS